MSRIRVAPVVALAVVAGQVVGALALLIVVGVLFFLTTPLRALPVVGDILTVAFQGLVIISPIVGAGMATVFVYNRLDASRFPPTASFLVTFAMSLIGSRVGEAMGGIFFDRGHLIGGGLGAPFGGFLGATFLVMVVNLKQPETSLADELRKS